MEIVPSPAIKGFHDLQSQFGEIDNLHLSVILVGLGSSQGQKEDYPKCRFLVISRGV